MTKKLANNAIFLAISGLLLANTGWAQMGGQTSFAFLNLPNSPTATALGAYPLASSSQDIALANLNPAHLRPNFHQLISFNTSFLLKNSGIINSYASYSHYAEHINTVFHAGIQFIDYGKFTWTDEASSNLGNFRASEMALTMGAAYPIRYNLHVGANIKLINSRFEQYQAFALSSDWAISYDIAEKKIQTSLVINHLGATLKSFSDNETPSLPLQIAWSFSKKFTHLPFKYYLTLHHLQQWNITYDDPNSQDEVLFLGNEKQENNALLFLDNLLRHVSLAGELSLGKNDLFQLRIAYNHLQRMELKVNNTSGLAGFSMGMGLRIGKLYLDYGKTFYHLAGSSNHLGIHTELGVFRR